MRKIGYFIKEGSSDDHLNSVENYLKGLGPLHLAHQKEIPGDTIEKQILFIIEENIHRHTYDNNNYLKCRRSRRRSAGDLYRILIKCKPEISFKDFREALINLLNDGKDIRSFYCNDIQKQVYFGKYHSTYGFDTDSGWDRCLRDLVHYVDIDELDCEFKLIQK